MHTAGIRLMFAMARDNALPGARMLARVDPRRQTPVVPAEIIGALAVLILAVNIGTPEIFTAVTSVAVILTYLAYLLVTVPVLIRRLRGQGPASSGSFTLGRLGLPVTIVAMLWGAGMALNLAWPRVEVYGSGPLQYSAFIVVGAVVVVGPAWYVLRGRRRLATVPEHRPPS